MTITCTAFAYRAEITASPISADQTSARTPLPCHCHGSAFVPRSGFSTGRQPGPLLPKARGRAWRVRNLLLRLHFLLTKRVDEPRTRLVVHRLEESETASGRIRYAAIAMEPSTEARAPGFATRYACVLCHTLCVRPLSHLTLCTKGVNLS